MVDEYDLMVGSMLLYFWLSWVIFFFNCFFDLFLVIIISEWKLILEFEFLFVCMVCLMGCLLVVVMVILIGEDDWVLGVMFMFIWIILVLLSFLVIDVLLIIG